MLHQIIPSFKSLQYTTVPLLQNIHPIPHHPLLNINHITFHTKQCHIIPLTKYSTTSPFLQNIAPHPHSCKTPPHCPTYQTMHHITVYEKRCITSPLLQYTAPHHPPYKPMHHIVLLEKQCSASPLLQNKTVYHCTTSPFLHYSARHIS
jgi:hypothetical protein